VAGRHRGRWGDAPAHAYGVEGVGCLVGITAVALILLVLVVSLISWMW